MGAASRKESPAPRQTSLAPVARSEAQAPPARAASPPRRPTLSPLARPPARSLPGPVWAVRRAPAPAPAPARSQSVFHANPCAAPFPSAVAAPWPPGLPASSPAPRHLLPRAPCPPPASRRAMRLPRPARSTPTWATGTAAAGPGARRIPRGPDRTPASAGRKSWERRGGGGSSLGVSGRTELDWQPTSPVRPEAGGAPLGGPGSERERTPARLGPGKAGRALGRVRARADPGPGPGRGAVFSLSHRCGHRDCRATWERGEMSSPKWALGDLGASLERSCSLGSLGLCE